MALPVVGKRKEEWHYTYITMTQKAIFALFEAVVTLLVSARKGLLCC
jgi:hypothetical protein